jgi:hypothetical protein
MNTETDRLINGIQFINGAINSRILKDSQEYYALAVIKSLFPDDYKTLVKKETDRPDLKNIDDLYGVEVTTADSKIDNEDNRLFDIYGKDKKKKIKDKLEKHGKKISETNGIMHLSSGGGYGVEKDNQLLIHSITEKIKSAAKYASNYKFLDLVVIKNERVPSNWEDEIFSCVDAAVSQNKKMFRNIFVIYNDCCYWVDIDGQHKKLRINNRDRLKLLGRLTAEGVIKVEDEEWK